MRVYHERLRVPLSWWLLGMAVIVLLGAEVGAGWGWRVTAVVYAVLVGFYVAMLVSWGRASVEVTSDELRVGGARLPLAAVGEVSALDQAQTRAIRGPRADPAAFLLVRPYLRQSVYVEVTDPAIGVPYWLLGSRRPADLASAISRSRPAARAGDSAVG
ncbi:MAG TPA: DUF3093 domain-containing protein [Streptosporangiaceae bacterium]|nr:DUF3093 domain-containing protein [Streptosporangiaceae bacterium]